MSNLQQFSSIEPTQYNFFSSPNLLPDCHPPSFFSFSASPSPTFDESLHLPLEGTSEPSTSFIYPPPSRLRSGNRVPRPRNAFMIFRSEFSAGQKISRTVEHDHRHISRIIGHCWNQLPDVEKDKWRQKAEQEKVDHMMKYPGYRFSPTVRTKKVVKRKVKRNSEEELLRCKQVAELLLAGKQGVELDSAVKSIKSSLDSTALKERKQGSEIVTSSPKAGQLRTRSKSPITTIERSSNFSALDHSNIPIFRSPLLPPTEMPPSLPSTSQSPSSFHYGSHQSTSADSMNFQQFELPSPSLYISSFDGLRQDEGLQQVPPYFPRPPSLDGYSSGPGVSNAHSKGQTSTPYLHYNYGSVPDDFYGMSPSNTTEATPVFGRTSLDPLAWDFSVLSSS